MRAMYTVEFVGCRFKDQNLHVSQGHSDGILQEPHSMMDLSPLGCCGRDGEGPRAPDCPSLL